MPGIMSNPKLSWNQIISGKCPRGNGDLGALRVLLWRLIRVCEEGAYHSLEAGDEDRLIKYINAASNLAARFRDCHADDELNRKLDELIAKRQNSQASRPFTLDGEVLG